MGKLSQITEQAKLAERTVVLCTRGDLNADLEELQRELAIAERDFTRQTLADRSPARDIAERIEALREQMRGHEHEFRFRALPPLQFSDLLAAHPPRDDKGETLFNADTFPPACIAAALVAVDGEAETTTEQEVSALMSKLNSGQRDELFDAAYRVNVKPVDVPFSPLASRVLRDTEQS